MISCLPAGSAAAASAGGARVIGQRLQPGRDLLVRLHQQVQHVTCDVLVLLVEERCCQTYKEMFVSALLVCIWTCHKAAFTCHKAAFIHLSW